MWEFNPLVVQFRSVALYWFFCYKPPSLKSSRLVTYWLLLQLNFNFNFQLNWITLRVDIHHSALNLFINDFELSTGISTLPDPSAIRFYDMPAFSELHSRILCRRLRSLPCRAHWIILHLSSPDTVSLRFLVFFNQPLYSGLTSSSWLVTWQMLSSRQFSYWRILLS